jgi:iron complex outermembrane receptor protein
MCLRYLYFELSAAPISGEFMNKMPSKNLVGLISLFISFNGWSQSSPANIELEEVIVTASAHAKTEAQLVSSVNILDQQDLQREAAVTLGETLQNQVGVHSSSFGPGVGTPIIRGQSGKRVEVLQNNTSVGDVSDTSADHAIATEAMLADRIEILRGPATLRFGGGAIGGVVNVLNNRIHEERSEGFSGAMETRYSDNNDETVFVGRFDAGIGNVGLHLDLVNRDSGDVTIPGLADLEADDPDETTDGYIANSDRQADSYGIGVSWINDNLIAGFSISDLKNNYGVPAGAHGHHEDEDHSGAEITEELEEFVRIDMQQTTYEGKLSFPDLAGSWIAANFDFSYTDYGHKELEIADGISEIGTIFDTTSNQFRGEITHETTNGWLGTFGVQRSYRDFSAFGEEAFVVDSGTESVGLFVIEETQLGAGTLELGGRIDRQNIEVDGLNDLDHSSINISASLLYPLGDNSRISFILSRSERAPVAEELLSDGEHVATSTYEVGDLDLQTEKALNFEATWVSSFTESNFTPQLRATLYHNRFSDYIFQQDTELLFNHDLADQGALGLASCTEEGNFDHPAEAEEAVECFAWQQQDAKFTGVEAEINFSLLDSQSLRFWGDFVLAKLDTNGDVPRIPPARIGANWDFEQDNWIANLSLVHAFKQDRPGENQEETAGYNRVDAYVSYNTDGWSLFFKGTNLSNEEIRNSTSITREVAPEPGRALTLGARYSF